MDLTSCENCGVVLDKDRLDFYDFDLDKPDIDAFGPMEVRAGRFWVSEGYVVAVACPVCQFPIPEKENA